MTRFDVKVLMTISQPDEVELVEVFEVRRRFSRYGFVFPSSFNRTCTSQFLDVPRSLVRWCSSAPTTNQSSSVNPACERLTCANLLRGDDQQLYDLAVNLSTK